LRTTVALIPVWIVSRTYVSDRKRETNDSGIFKEHEVIETSTGVAPTILQSPADSETLGIMERVFVAMAHYKSVHIPIRTLLAGFGGRSADERILAMFTAYMDESGDAKSQLVTLSCLVGWQTAWESIEEHWRQMLEKKNSELKLDNRPLISRYHATDCANYYNEFQKWTPEEQRQFTREIIEIFKKHNLVITSYTLSLNDLREVFPEAAEKGREKELAHVILLNHLVVYMSEKVLDDPRWCGDPLMVIHDWSEHNAVLVDAFGHLKDDTKLKHHDKLATIAPMTWQQCLLLQPADFIAYENFKIVERSKAGKPVHVSFQKILELESIGGKGVEITKEGLQEIKSKLDADPETRIAMFEDARILPK
jgi:hypothetical protein